MVKEFDGLEYTRLAILEELALIERHARDGSAVDAGCACIEEKHLLNLAGLSSEGVTLATDKNEKDYYMNLASWARKTRQDILNGDFGATKVKCEAAVQKCMAKGKSEAECRVKAHCP